MLKLALKSLLGRKLRMLLTAFSIIIGVSFVAGSYIFTDSMSATFENLFDNAYDSIDVIIQPVTNETFGPGGDSGAVETLPVSIIEELEAIDGVSKAEGEVNGDALILKKDGSVAATGGAPSRGFSWNELPEFNLFSLTEESRAPTAPGEVVIDANTAEVNEFAVGDTIQIVGLGPVEEFQIVGIVTFGEANSLAGATAAAFELTEAQRFFGLDDGFSIVNVTSAGGISADELKQRIDGALPQEVEAITGEQQKSNDLEEVNQGLEFLNTALLAFAGISIFVGSFIIQNTFRIIVTQRSKELALLRALGATKRQIIRLVAYEAFFVAVFASAMGIVAGIGISRGLRTVTKLIGIDLPSGPLTLESRTIYVCFAVGIGVTMVSAILPAIKASRVSPIEAMRDQESSAPRSSLAKRAFAGFFITGIGAAALLYGLFSTVKDPIYFVGAGAGIMFIGISIIAPLLSKPFAIVIGKPLELILGVTGKLAGRNAKRSPRRTAATASALMIGVSLVAFASIFASSIKATVDSVVSESFPGDITITNKQAQSSPPGGAVIPAEVAEKVEKLDEIELASQFKYNFVKLEGSEALIVAIDPDTVNEAYALKPTDDSYGNLIKDTVYVNQAEMENKSLFIGAQINVEYAQTGVKSLTVSGTFEEPFDSPYLISIATYQDNFATDTDTLVVANVVDGVSIEDGQSAVSQLLEQYPTIQAQDKNELVAQTRKQIDQVLGLLSALLGFAILIAVLGIANTLTLSVAERTREIGMLRAIGMTRGQVRRMIQSEAVIIAVFGALLGVLMGVFFAWAILRALEDIGFSSFSVPFTQIAGYLVAAAVAGMIAAIFPSVKASRMNILNAINYE